MTPAQIKAKELVDKYLNAEFNCKDCNMPYCDIPCTKLALFEAKQCALITVEFARENPLNTNEYLDELKQEINNL